MDGPGSKSPLEAQREAKKPDRRDALIAELVDALDDCLEFITLETGYDGKTEDDYECTRLARAVLAKAKEQGHEV